MGKGGGKTGILTAPNGQKLQEIFSSHFNLRYITVAAMATIPMSDDAGHRVRHGHLLKVIATVVKRCYGIRSHGMLVETWNMEHDV